MHYNQGYLYFFFIVVFLSQEIQKYKGSILFSEDEVENLEQAFLRVLINEDVNSALNLCKFSRAEMDSQEYNPFYVATHEID